MIARPGRPVLLLTDVPLGDLWQTAALPGASCSLLIPGHYRLIRHIPARVSAGVCVCYGSYCLSLTLSSCVQPLCIYCSFAAHLHKRQIINTHPAQSVCRVCSLWFREVYLSRWKMQPCLYFNLDLCARPVVRLTSHACERVCICLRPHLDANGRRRRRDGDKGRWRWCLETERLDAAE